MRWDGGKGAAADLWPGNWAMRFVGGCIRLIDRLMEVN